MAVADASSDPVARYSQAESVRLAFVAALQLLPPRQRAVLLLRDVLAYSAAEVATILEMPVGAANSALHRARRRLEAAGLSAELATMPEAWPEDPAIARLLEAYVGAWERDDVAAIVSTLRSEVRLAMPPSPSWFAGRDDVIAFLSRWVLSQGRFALTPVIANGQPAYVMRLADPDVPRQPRGLQVLTVRSDGVMAIECFMDPAVAGRFVPGGASIGR
jgi:RNA polymerase sigma-70 factor (ECF subfamily)